MPIYNNEKFIEIMRPLPSNWPRDKFGIPFVKKSEIDISNINNGKWLIGLNNANASDNYAYRKIIHSQKFDDDFKRFLNHPYKILEFAGRYYAISTFDISMHEPMEVAQIIYATFINRWSGAFLQSQGIERIAVTLGWVNEDTYDICFSGVEDGTLLIISTLGVCNDECSFRFIKGYMEARRRFPNSQFLCVGNKIEGMDDDVCYVSYNQSFGNWDKYRDYWQPSLLNWDLKGADF